MGNAPPCTARERAGDLSKVVGSAFEGATTDGSLTQRVDTFLIKKKFFVSQRGLLDIRNARNEICYKSIFEPDGVIFTDKSGIKYCKLVKNSELAAVFYVYTYCPNFSDQQPEDWQVKDNNGTPLYRWAVIQQEMCGVTPKTKLSVYVSYDVLRPALIAELEWSLALKLCMIEVETGQVVGCMNDVGDSTVVSLTVAPGCDALGMICLAIAIDDLRDEKLTIFLEGGAASAQKRIK